GAVVDMEPGRDVWHHEAAKVVTSECPCEHMNAEDPLFILYTSGSTGKPKGVLHTTGGYLVYVAMTHQYIFDYHDGDIYWCTAAGGDAAQARIGDAAVLRHRPADRGRGRQGAGRRGHRKSLHCRFLAGNHAHRVWRSPALHRHLFQGLSRQVLHRRRLPARCG